MTAAKIAITIPAETLKLAKRRVTSGRSKSLSALVTEAVEEKLCRDELVELLDAMDVEYGRPNKAAKSWAKKVLARSSSTPAR